MCLNKAYINTFSAELQDISTAKVYRLQLMRRQG